MNFRQGIIRGGHLFGNVSLPRAGSIENRLIRLLDYLAAHQPGRGWDQYLQGRQGLRWSKIAFGGHSQGGGHAYVIAKYHPVARGIMFGSPKDFSFHFNRPANGFDSSTRTARDRFFAFNHMRDNGNGCNHVQQVAVLQQIGLNDLGILRVAGGIPTFHHQHVLYTDVNVPNKNYHGATLNAKFGFQPTWKYMLQVPVQ